jgi:hypothetical protein
LKRFAALFGTVHLAKELQRPTKKSERDQAENGGMDLRVAKQSRILLLGYMQVLRSFLATEAFTELNTSYQFGISTTTVNESLLSPTRAPTVQLFVICWVLPRHLGSGRDLF